MSPEKLFDALVEYYNSPQPDGLNAAELEDWLERGRGKTQRKVLEIFSDWLQVNHLLQEEPYIARRLTEFLQSLEAGPNGKVSTLIQERIKDLVKIILRPYLLLRD
jgi:son of sevenless-like protein